jgi:chromosome segregation ATPase
MALKNGYARLKVRYDKLQDELAAEQKKTSDLQTELEKSQAARRNLHKTLDESYEREAWLFEHSLWIVRVWFVKHFNLKR